MRDIQIFVMEKRLKIKDFRGVFVPYKIEISLKCTYFITFRFARKNHISFYQSITFRFVGFKNGRMNWWGMFFAFLSLVALVGLSALALYLDHEWFAGIFGFSAVVSIITVFVNAGKDNELKK